MNSNISTIDSDYVVIGGGIVGTCISYYLSCLNKEVICVDSGEFSGSNSNAGSIHVQLQSRNFRLNPHLIENLKGIISIEVVSISEVEAIAILKFHTKEDEENSRDELYDKAVAIICREGKASTSFVQRHLQIGYNRAARIIEKMEKEGVVSPADRVGRREVLAGDHSIWGKK